MNARQKAKKLKKEVEQLRELMNPRARGYISERRELKEIKLNTSVSTYMIENERERKELAARCLSFNIREIIRQQMEKAPESDPAQEFYNFTFWI